ncbi:hypothetical protein V0M98_37290 (plasmid) [Pseudomonas silesiensis]|uniref:hypothetical protein n=1 Tax=Pseudomonas silesiensis TaxID=1853130 RepID=UPI0030CAAF3D
MSVTHLIERIQAWLDPLDSLPVECDGMTRVIMALLAENGIQHRAMGGYLANVAMLKDESVGNDALAGCAHWWIELPTGHLIDYRARMWMGPGAQHGVFIHDPTDFEYLQAQPANMGSQSIQILSFMVDRDLTKHPKLGLSREELKALNSPEKSNPICGKEEIGAAIRKARDEYLTDYGISSYFDLNNGFCDDFALQVIMRLGSPEHLYDLGNENLQDEDGYWDWGLIMGHWEIEAPEGLSCDEVDQLDFGGHIFIADNAQRRFYDAECPNGVSSFFDLPLFRREIVRALRLKGIPTEEVLSEDVVPPPKCPVNNPVVSRPADELSDGSFSI